MYKQVVSDGYGTSSRSCYSSSDVQPFNSLCTLSYFSFRFHVHFPLLHIVLTSSSALESSEADEASSEVVPPFSRCVSRRAKSWAFCKDHCPKGSHPLRSPCILIFSLRIFECCRQPYSRSTFTLFPSGPSTTENEKGAYFFLHTATPIVSLPHHCPSPHFSFIFCIAVLCVSVDADLLNMLPPYSSPPIPTG